MANLQSCTYLGATICPGYTGTSPVWVNKKIIPGKSLATGCAFTFNGACYSLPADAQPATPPGSAAYATSIGTISSGCADCCDITVNPRQLCLNPPETGPVGFTITGASGSPYTLNWASSAITVQVAAATITSPYSGTLPSGGVATVSVQFNSPTVIGETADITVSGCGMAIGVAIICGGSTCSGTQPSSVQITDASDLTFVLGAGACSAPITYCTCNYSLPLTLTTVSPCDVYDIPNAVTSDNCSIGGIGFVNQSIHLANSSGVWSVGMLSCNFNPPYAYGPVQFGFVKSCGNDPTGRYFYLPNNGPVDYTHWIDVE
ncbi:MAG: hypothetical protein ACP5I8_12195 [Phycisphaerae bacterium]